MLGAALTVLLAVCFGVSLLMAGLLYSKEWERSRDVTVWIIATCLSIIFGVATAISGTLDLAPYIFQTDYQPVQEHSTGYQLIDGHKYIIFYRYGEAYGVVHDVNCTSCKAARNTEEE